MAKIVIGMSGGVDSSVSAYLLKSQGHEVIGIFMRNWDAMANNDILGNPDLKVATCPQEQDYQDALAVATQLNIKLLRVDFVEQYYKLVFENLIEEYENGRTPNPDILCNKHIKFGALLEYVKTHIPDFDYLAMGHYASVQNGKLYKPVDSFKDQTYFLSQLSAEQLTKVLFPLANLTKAEVRIIAQKNHLINADKKESMGICFIGKRNFTEFLKNYIPAQPGKIVDLKTMQIIGDHQGAMYYTIGQRHGLKLGGMSNPYYVAGHNLKKRLIYVANDKNSSYLQSDQALIKNVNWIIKNYEPKNLMIKFRYRSEAVQATMQWEGKNIIVRYAAHLAVTPGQQCVFYDQNLCLGGGVIDQIYFKNKLKKYV